MRRREAPAERWQDLGVFGRIALVVYLVADLGFFVLLYLGFFAAVLQWRVGVEFS